MGALAAGRAGPIADIPNTGLFAFAREVSTPDSRERQVRALIRQLAA